MDLHAMHRASVEPFHPQTNNCGTAVLAAFPVLAEIVKAWPRNARDIRRAATRAAAKCGHRCAGASGPAWGVADFKTVQILCARADTVWLCRTEPRGLAIVPSNLIVCSWSVPQCPPS